MNGRSRADGFRSLPAPGTAAPKLVPYHASLRSWTSWPGFARITMTPRPPRFQARAGSAGGSSARFTAPQGTPSDLHGRRMGARSGAPGSGLGSGIRLVKRRGRDLNPRRTQRPETVFETAAFDRSATPPRGRLARGFRAAGSARGRLKRCHRAGNPPRPRSRRTLVGAMPQPARTSRHRPPPQCPGRSARAGRMRTASPDWKVVS